MRVWDIYFSRLAFVAALCFAVLSGLHIVRPVTAEVSISSYGFGPDDICGYGEEGTTRDCPNCILAVGVLNVDPVNLQFWQALVAEYATPIDVGFLFSQGAVAPYWARGPPIFT